MNNYRYKRFLSLKKILLTIGNLSFLTSVLSFSYMQYAQLKGGHYHNLTYFSLLVGVVTFTTGLVLFPLLYGRSEGLERQRVADLFSDVTKLLTSKEIEKVTPLDVFNAVEKCKTNFLDGQEELRRIYTSALLYYLRAKTLRDQEVRNLVHIRKILFLGDSQVRLAEKEVQHPMLRRSLHDILLEQVPFEERPALEQLRLKALLPENFSIPLRDEGALGPQQRVRNRIDFDKELAPREVEELQALKSNLAIEREDPPTLTKGLLETCRLYWFLRNDELPLINLSEFVPRKDEKLHYETEATFYLAKKFAVPNTDVPSLLNKIVRGHYWRVETPIAKRLTEDLWTAQEEGKLYVTSQRVFFAGTKVKQSFPLSRLVDYNPCTNGLELHPLMGAEAFFEFMNSPEAVAVTLGAAIKSFYQGG